MSQFFPSGGQSVGGSASPLVLPNNSQDWFHLGGTGWISLQFKGLPRVLPNTTVQKHQLFGIQLSLWPNSHIHPWLYRCLVVKENLCFLVCCQVFSIFFFPRGASAFSFTAAVIICSDFGSKENRVCHCFHCFSMYVPWSNGTGCNYPGFMISTYHIKAIHKKMKYKKAQWLSEEVLQIT